MTLQEIWLCCKRYELKENEAPQCINAAGQIEPWSCKSALRKWHMRRSVGGCGAGAGRVRWALWSADASL